MKFPPLDKYDLAIDKDKLRKLVHGVFYFFMGVALVSLSTIGFCLSFIMWIYRLFSKRFDKEMKKMDKDGRVAVSVISTEKNTETSLVGPPDNVSVVSPDLVGSTPSATFETSEYVFSKQEMVSYDTPIEVILPSSPNKSSTSSDSLSEGPTQEGRDGSIYIPTPQRTYRKTLEAKLR